MAAAGQAYDLAPVCDHIITLLERSLQTWKTASFVQQHLMQNSTTDFVAKNRFE